MSFIETKNMLDSDDSCLESESFSNTYMKKSPIFSLGFTSDYKVSWGFLEKK